jgi:hypothetical protein
MRIIEGLTTFFSKGLNESSMSKKRKRQSRILPSQDFQTTTTTSSTKRLLGREFNPDYSYVIKDLRRIGILAGTFFMVLVVLSFFLR